MRRIAGLLMVVTVFAVQVGFAHATICKNLMAARTVPAESHCGLMKAKTEPGCGGMAGCRDLCNRERPTAPQVSGKIGADSIVLLQADAPAPQSIVSRTVSACFESVLALNWESPPGEGGVPDAFLLHGAFLI